MHEGEYAWGSVRMEERTQRKRKTKRTPTPSNSDFDSSFLEEMPKKKKGKTKA